MTTRRVAPRTPCRILVPVGAARAPACVVGVDGDRILARGADQAREITAPILKRTYEIVGMVG